MSWSVYVLYSPTTGRTYTGITTDPVRRLREHNGKGGKGAKSTRAGRPWWMGHVEPASSKSAALKRERAIKKLTPTEKRALLKLTR